MLGSPGRHNAMATEVGQASTDSKASSVSPLWELDECLRNALGDLGRMDSALATPVDTPRQSMSARKISDIASSRRPDYNQSTQDRFRTPGEPTTPHGEQIRGPW